LLTRRPVDAAGTSPGSGRNCHSSGREPATSASQPSRPDLQLMGQAVRAVLDIAGREQRQNALLDLLDELALSGCETASRWVLRSTIFQCDGTDCVPAVVFLPGRPAVSTFILILTPENGSGPPSDEQPVSVTFRSSRAPSSSRILRTLSRNPSQEIRGGKPLINEGQFLGVQTADSRAACAPVSAAVAQPATVSSTATTPAASTRCAAPAPAFAYRIKPPNVHRTLRLNSKFRRPRPPKR